MEKITALAAYLECDVADISEIRYDENTFACGSREYLVLTDDEADEKAREYIRDSVWAFNASFLQGYGSFAMLDSGDIDRLRGDRCEDINEAFVAMIGDDFEQFASDAISADGRGHFLSTYDGHENEHGEFFIYKN